MKNLLTRFVREEQGQDVVEYVLLAAGIGLVVIPGAQAFGGAMNDIYGRLATRVGLLVP